MVLPFFLATPLTIGLAISTYKFEDKRCFGILAKTLGWNIASLTAIPNAIASVHGVGNAMLLLGLSPYNYTPANAQAKHTEKVTLDRRERILRRFVEDIKKKTQLHQERALFPPTLHDDEYWRVDKREPRPPHKSKGHPYQNSLVGDHELGVWKDPNGFLAEWNEPIMERINFVTYDEVRDQIQWVWNGTDRGGVCNRWVERAYLSYSRSHTFTGDSRYPLFHTTPHLKDRLRKALRDYQLGMHCNGYIHPRSETKIMGTIQFRFSPVGIEVAMNMLRDPRFPGIVKELVKTNRMPF